MKSLLPLTLLLAAATPLTLHAEDAPLKDQKDKVSYTIGVNIGNNIKRDQLDISADLVAKGLKDALSNAKLALTDAEMQATMEAFKAEMQKKFADKAKAAGDNNKVTGEKFLEENKKKEGVITTKSGLQYKVLAEGKGPKAKSTDTVEVNYRGTLIDGTEFDASSKHGGAATFRADQVIPGWTEALQLMSEGSKLQLFIPSNLAYGENAPPSIGPNSTLLFDVELLKIKPSEAATTSGTTGK